jgi:hypothetical protein
VLLRELEWRRADGLWRGSGKAVPELSEFADGGGRSPPDNRGMTIFLATLAIALAAVAIVAARKRRRRS